MLMGKRVVSLSMDESLVERFDEWSRSHGWSQASQGKTGGTHKGRDSGRSALTTHLWEALIEGRLTIQERSGANPFPGQELEAGENPQFPIYIARGEEP